MIPCKECITYAICALKEEIICSRINEISTYDTANTLIDEVLDLFPRAKCIMLDPPDEPTVLHTDFSPKFTHVRLVV